MRPSPPVIKLSLEGQVGMSSIKRVDPRKYAENDIVNELRRRAIEMAREQQQTSSAQEDEKRDSSSNSIHHQSPNEDSYKVILKYKDVDGEECMIVTRDDIKELMHQYARFANVQVYAQVHCKNGDTTTTTIVDESRDEVEATATPSEAAKNEIRNDEDCRDVAEKTTSILTENTGTLWPFRSIRKNLGLLATRSTKRGIGDDETIGIESEVKAANSSETSKRKGKKKFAFLIPMKMRPKKGGPLQLASLVDQSNKKKDGVKSDKTSDDNNSPKDDVTDNRTMESVPNDGTRLHAPTFTSAVVAADNTLQPVLFLDENGKAVTKVVQEIKNEAIALFQCTSGSIQRSGAQDGNSILQFGAKGTRMLMSCRGGDAGDRDTLCITPPLTGMCHDCEATEDIWSGMGATMCCLPSDIPALCPRNSNDSATKRAQIGITALRDVNSAMMSMDLAEMASIFGAGWWPTNASKDVDVGTTLPAETRQPAPAWPSSSVSGPLFADEQDMQKAMQRLFLASNDLLAHHSASRRSDLSTVKELDEESDASADGSLALPKQKDFMNGRSAFQNYENDDVPLTKISSSSSSHGNKRTFKNSGYSISQSINDVLFSNWSTPAALSAIKEIDETGPEIDRGDDGDEYGCNQDNVCLDHPASKSATDALLSHVSVFALGGAEKANEIEDKNVVSRSTMLLRNKLPPVSRGVLSLYNKLRKSASLIEFDDICCSPSLTDPAMSSDLGRSKVKQEEENGIRNENQPKQTVNCITGGVSTVDSKDGSTASALEHSTQLGKRHSSNSNNTASATASDEDMQRAMWLTNLSRTSSRFSTTADFSELLLSLSTFSVLDSKMKRTESECNDNGAFEWSQESYVGFLLATLSGPISSRTPSPSIDLNTSTISRNITEVMPDTKQVVISAIRSPSYRSPAVNKDKIPLTLSSTIFKKKSNVQEDEKSVSSTLKANRSNCSYRSSVKTVEGLLSLSDDGSHHSAKISVQSKSSTEGKQGKVALSRSTASSPAVTDVDAVLSTLSSSTGTRKQPEQAHSLSSSSASSASFAHQAEPNMQAVLARSIEDAESFAGLLRANLSSGPVLSTKPKHASLDVDDKGKDYADVDIDNKRGDGQDAASYDDDTAPFNLTDFLADFDDVSTALSGLQHHKEVDVVTSSFSREDLPPLPL